MAEINWRTINIDAYDPESCYNFDLKKGVYTKPTGIGWCMIFQTMVLIRMDCQAIHLSLITELLQSIRQADMTPLLQRLYASPNGSETCDTLMKYLYKGMAQGTTGHTQTGQGGKTLTPQATGFTQAGGRSFGGAEGGGQGMSVLLSWHEK
ncbi:hypothetical protein B0A48_03722 [Cryoendolithus antarcticus]|uniref:Actin-related protein 2/3 complex subunit 5 n=1 Tax=Cryoendolithus antarcticus TaxID=1507870 RepID=A0A1V8TGC0_9PEZI|nr:hypothetical protein B0A48_03722 [Cryoendolithus antarcticus]